MLTVEDYGRIRRAHRDGMSVRAIARTFHHSRRKVREALQNPEPRPYTRTRSVHAPKLGPFHPIIDAIRGRSVGPAQAAAHGDAGVPPTRGRARLPRRVRRRATVHQEDPPPGGGGGKGGVRRSSRFGTTPASVRKPTSGISMLTFPTAVAGFRC